MSDALVQLAERCEAATGPNFELEREIADAVWRAKWGKRRPKDIAPKPCTASLDAAMTLVPPEHAVDLTVWANTNRARLLPIVQDGDRWIYRGSDPHYCANGTTAALALTAAALRALAKGRG